MSTAAAITSILQGLGIMPPSAQSVMEMMRASPVNSPFKEQRVGREGKTLSSKQTWGQKALGAAGDYAVSSVIQQAFTQPQAPQLQAPAFAPQQPRALSLSGMGVYPAHQVWQQQRPLAVDPILRAFQGV